MEKVICHDVISSNLDKMEHEVYQREEYIPDGLEMTPADVNDVKSHHPQEDLRVQL